MSESEKSKVEKDKSLSIPELLADFFLKKIGMPSDSEDSDPKHKSKKKKSKHKKQKHRKSKHSHRSSSSDVSRTSDLNRKVLSYFHFANLFYLETLNCFSCLL